MKRFTETDKWLDPFYRDLPPDFKHLWNFMNDRCDNAGVWAVDFGLFRMLSGIKISPAEARETLSSEITPLNDKLWIINGFLEFQYSQLSDKSHPHRKILSIIAKHGLILKGLRLYPSDSLLPSSDYPSPSLQEEEEEEDKEGEGECEGKGVSEPPDSVPVNGSAWHPSEVQLRINSWFGRRDSTKWSKGEIKTFREIGEIPPQDLDDLEAYYTRPRPSSEKDIRRRDLSTLLNNWNGEVDRARGDRRMAGSCNRGF